MPGLDARTSRRDDARAPPSARAGQQRGNVSGEAADFDIALTAPDRRRQFGRQRRDQRFERCEVAGAGQAREIVAERHAVTLFHRS